MKHDVYLHLNSFRWESNSVVTSMSRLNLAIVERRLDDIMKSQTFLDNCFLRMKKELNKIIKDIEFAISTDSNQKYEDYLANIKKMADELEAVSTISQIFNNCERLILLQYHNNLCENDLTNQWIIVRGKKMQLAEFTNRLTDTIDMMTFWGQKGL